MSYRLMRQVHLGLAALFLLPLLVIAGTGIILGINAIYRQQHSDVRASWGEEQLSSVAKRIQGEYDTPLKLERNRWGEFSLQYLDEDGEEQLIALDPSTASSMGDSTEEDSSFIRSTITLHRSLTGSALGRTIVLVTTIGFLALLLSGAILLGKSGELQALLKRKQIGSNWAMRWHLYLALFAFIPLAVLSITALTLANTTSANQQLQLEQPQELSSLKIKEIESLSFPLPEDEELYYTIVLRDRGLIKDLHTGSSSSLWAGVLTSSVVALIGLCLSGFISFVLRCHSTNERFPKAGKSIDEHKPIDILLLVGSEQGETLGFASLQAQQWQLKGLNVRLSLMNDYKLYEQEIKHLLIFTSTYGKGEAPKTATNFITLFQNLGRQLHSTTPIPYAVLGFGSRRFPLFCAYAQQIDKCLAEQAWLTPLLPLHTVSDQDNAEIQAWLDTYNSLHIL